MEDRSEFLTIGFTEPEEWKSVLDEAYAIIRFLTSGAIDLFHIRKTGENPDYTSALLEAVPQELRGRLVLHSHYFLWNEFKPGGIHFKETLPTEIYRKAIADREIVSAGAHSLKELEEKSELIDKETKQLLSGRDSEPLRYVFLSPIYDSISKKGYRSRFSLDNPGLLHSISQCQTIALGGIKPAFFSELYDAKFAGAALLGYLWSPKTSIEDKINAIMYSRNKLNTHK